MNTVIRRRMLSVMVTAGIVAGASFIPGVIASAETKVDINATNFPDETFMKYVQENFDKDSNGSLDQAEIDAVKEIDFMSYDLKNVQGIGFFTSLERVEITSNTVPYEPASVDLSGNTKIKEIKLYTVPIESLDLSKNTALEHFDSFNTPLTSLDLSSNTGLKTLDVTGADITSLDLSKNTGLLDLKLSKTKIKDLDLSKCAVLREAEIEESSVENVNASGCSKLERLTLKKNGELADLTVSGCTSLEQLNVNGSKIMSLDVSDCTSLGYFDCPDNKLSELKLGNISKIHYMSCGSNQLASLDVSTLPELKKLDCSKNQLKSLDVSANPELDDLDCGYNKLTSLDISCNEKLGDLSCVHNDIATLDISSCPNLVYGYVYTLTEDPYDYDNPEPDDTIVTKYYDPSGNDGQEGHFRFAFDKTTKIVSNQITVKPSKDTVVCGKTITVSVDLGALDKDTEVTYESSDKSIATVDKNGKVKGVAAGVVTITAITSGNVKASCKIRVLYKDVTNTKDFWYKPTNELTEMGVVKGYNKQTKFKPANKCTRAQMVTFIWRLVGEPEPKSKTCKFSDVKESDYFFKACIWGNENHIVEGYKDGTFGPQIVCARKHAVTFLWRLDGSPVFENEKCKFSDVKKSDYYYNAVIWASRVGIVAGYKNGTFKPNGDCLRRQMVTFLYKYYQYDLPSHIL